MDPDAIGRREKPCRTCTDFKTWSALNKGNINQSKEVEKPATQNAEPDGHNKECPVDKDELGRSTWNFLHTIAAFYPDKPTIEERTRTNNFLKLLAEMYPCEICAADFQKQIERFPPKTESQHELSQWLCRAHNRINLRIGKPMFDCSKVNERWRDGWKDGSCD